VSLLDQVVASTDEARVAQRTRLERFTSARGLDEALVLWLDARHGDATPSKASIVRRLTLDIARIDELLSAQLNAILHHPAFQGLEASWRGLRRLVDQVEEGSNCEVRVLGISWRELARDLDKAIEFDQSQIFHKVYSAEFGMPGGKPFGVLLGDFVVAHKPRTADKIDDVAALRSMSHVAAAAFAPFVVGAHPSLFGLDAWSELERPIDLARALQGPEYTKWNALRDTDDARFLGITLPRALMRHPWRDDPRRNDGFRFREDVSQTDSWLFGSAIYSFGEVLIRAFSECGWLAGIRGVDADIEGGGLVTTLPQTSFETDSAGLVPRAALDVQITDAREKELADLGLIPLCHCQGTSLAAFYSVGSLQRPAPFTTVEGTVNSKLSAMLQYVFCASRFAHYLKVIGRDRTGSFTTGDQLERMLNDWLLQYASSPEDMSDEMQARYPLSEAKARVRGVPGKPGVFMSEIFLRPHFQLDTMTTAIKLVTELAQPGEARR
jgi:type VI secretion system ImpC/EvpB family protein